MFTFLEVDLGLDPIPFDDLTAKYRVEAAITADFSGIYLDAEQYVLMERGPEWKLNRLRFTVAHELAHYFLHRDVPQARHFMSLPNYAVWTESYGGRNHVSAVIGQTAFPCFGWRFRGRGQSFNQALRFIESQADGRFWSVGKVHKIGSLMPR
ncbi:MAG: hypothetical protein NTV93_15055 [Verrucomicrobia bacterium]|nr:hypothetical protein [Verrucomicrobiota bacterium]